MNDKLKNYKLTTDRDGNVLAERDDSINSPQRVPKDRNLMTDFSRDWKQERKKRLTPEEEVILMQKAKDGDEERGSRWRRVIKHRRNLGKAELILSEKDATDFARAEAKSQLVIHLMPLAFSFIKEWPTLEPEEVISTCSLAILEHLDKALDRVKTFDFKTLCNYLFSTCQSALFEEWHSRKSVVSTPSDIEYQFKRGNASAKSLDKARQVLNPRSLEEEPRDSTVDDPLTLGETLAARSTPGHEDEFILEDGREKLREVFRQCLKPKEYLVIDLHYGLSNPDEPMSYEEISQVTGILKPTLGTLIGKAHKKLRVVPNLEQWLRTYSTPTKRMGPTFVDPLTLGLPEGTSVKGEANHNSKITEDDVRTIRKLRAEGQSVASVTKQFGISKRQVWMITSGKSWRHVK